MGHCKRYGLNMNGFIHYIYIFQGHFQPPGHGFHLDAPPPFEPVGIDPVQFDYNNMMPPSMDSPNFNNMDYSQVQWKKKKGKFMFKDDVNDTIISYKVCF